MIRKDLVQWQWSDYDPKHKHKINLWIHLVAVPMFWVGSLFLIAGFYGVGHFVVGLVLCFTAFVLQGLGHQLEAEKPTAFISFPDFISRFLVEQFITFPKFLLGGHWHRSL